MSDLGEKSLEKKMKKMPFSKKMELEMRKLILI
jgi:hypothetical protein